MSFLSPYDDFVEHTLSKCKGVLDQLNFVSEIRQRDGQYEHWGLGRAYGDRNAQQAMSEAHKKVFLDLLCVPLAGLLEELRVAAETGSDQQRYIAAMQQDFERLLPTDRGGGIDAHLSLVLETLRLLARRSDPSSPPGA